MLLQQHFIAISTLVRHYWLSSIYWFLFWPKLDLDVKSILKFNEPIDQNYCVESSNMSDIFQTFLNDPFHLKFPI